MPSSSLLTSHLLLEQNSGFPNTIYLFIMITITTATMLITIASDKIKVRRTQSVSLLDQLWPCHLSFSMFSCSPSPVINPVQVRLLILAWLILYGIHILLSVIAPPIVLALGFATNHLM